MNIFERIISLIAPHKCLQCGMEGALLCSGCLEVLQSVPSRCYRCRRVTESFRTCKPCRRVSGLYSVYTRTPYDGAARDLLHALKFERAREAAYNIASSLFQAVPAENVVITHTPTANQRVRLRGYDQAQAIARRLATITATQYTPLLLRLGAERQVGKRRSQRLATAPVFLPTNQNAIRNQHVLLVDDVITTGATLEAAAKVLKAAGAKRVSAAVFAVA